MEQDVAKLFCPTKKNITERVDEKSVRLLDTRDHEIANLQRKLHGCKTRIHSKTEQIYLTESRICSGVSDSISFFYIVRQKKNNLQSVK